LPILDPQVSHLRARERGDEVVLVERKAQVVDAGEIPLPRLDDDVDGAALELRQAELEADLVELLPAVPGLERGELLADPAVSRDQAEAELGEVAGLHLPYLRRHQVIVEEDHGRQTRGDARQVDAGAGAARPRRADGAAVR